MENIINLYDDEQSELILSQDFDPTEVNPFSTMGEKIEGDQLNLVNINMYQNKYFVEMHVFDEDDNFIVTLNSGRPLLRQPSTGKFYFDEYHYHDGTYMVGKIHNPYKHETLELVRTNQIVPYSYQAAATQAGLNMDDPDYVPDLNKYAIKLSEIFDILKGTPFFTLEEKTKYKIKYGIFTDVLTEVMGMSTFINGDDLAPQTQEDVPL